ncbi:serine hydrolase domain-containing protein [Sphaerisporangium sp. NPDC005289]|uniref:serine hydrolase domain-containing protein n=1 Tax=Sphaerisporangium sp. NPDC005289 TaxID=3155247 RepID=UPI0033A81A2F
MVRNAFAALCVALLPMSLPLPASAGFPASLPSSARAPLAAVPSSAGVLLAAVPSSGGAATAGAPPGVTPAAVDAFVDRYREATGLPGVAVALVKGGQVVHVAGYGRTATGERVTADTPMAVASVSKSFTSLAVMQLVEKGEVDLDGPVRDHLPEFTMADPRAARVTVRQLLDHTSGMADSAFHERSLPLPATLQGAVARLRTARLAAAPGTAFSYHNTNFQVAARLVEVVSGEPFAHYLRAHVFTPLGMRHSGTVDTERDLPGSARGHLYVLGHPFAVPEPAGFGGGSGGVLSTAADMARWLIAQNRGVPSERSARELRAASERHARYALGWELGTTGRGTPFIGHGGDLFTSTADQLRMPESGYGVAVMANTGTAFGDAHAITDGLVALIEDAEPEVPSALPYLLIDVVLLSLTLATAGLAARGVARSRRWAARRTGWQRSRLVPYLTPLALCAGMVPVFRVLSRGRDIAWIQLWYLYPTFMLWLVVAAVACTAVVVARLLGAMGARRR